MLFISFVGGLGGGSWDVASDSCPFLSCSSQSMQSGVEKKCFINGREKCFCAAGVLLRGTTERPARVFTCYYDKRGLIITQGALGTAVIMEKLPVSAAAGTQPLVLSTNSLNTCA